MHVLIAGVGYQNLRDMSLGPVLVTTLQSLDWPQDVEIEDLSYGPIAVVQQFEDRPGYYERLIFIAAVERGRAPGSVTCYRWPGALPDKEEIQQRVGEAVMGVISLDNLLIITQYFGVLPSDVFVIEVEPEDTGWGPGFTPRVEAAWDQVIETARQLAMEGRDG